ncbi:hypothetical protein GCM10009763_00060 [Dermacoccus profundi]|uniref:Uncharacterized protein n=1 Tax=Dermacoccus profundi TaxID=322602 RepID=A0ABN2CBK6_9MICO
MTPARTRRGIGMPSSLRGSNSPGVWGRAGRLVTTVEPAPDSPLRLCSEEATNTPPKIVQ